MLNRKTTILKTAAGALALLTAAAAGQACAQSSVVTSTNSSVTIYQPIQVAKQSDLSFGTVVRPASAAGDGVVKIDEASGAWSVTNGVAKVNGGPNAAAGRAWFKITGEGGASYSVSIPTQATMSNSAGDQITVYLKTDYNAATNPKLLNALGTTGTANVGVGGSIPITSTTKSGAYSATFNVTIEYN